MIFATIMTNESAANAIAEIKGGRVVKFETTASYVVEWVGKLTDLNIEAALNFARPIDDEDFGSQRQINAENRAFGYLMESRPDVFGEGTPFDDWSNKATIDERVDRAIELFNA